MNSLHQYFPLSKSMLTRITNLKVGFRAGAFITAMMIILSMYKLSSNNLNRTLIIPPILSINESPLIMSDFSRTEGFVSMCGWNRQDGVTISLQHIWSTLALAMLINRTFILSYLPGSAVMGDANQYIPFVDLFDINVLREAYGPDCCASPDEIDQTLRNHTRLEHDYERLIREFRENSSNLTTNKHIQVCGAPYNYVIRANITSVYEKTQPHPSLKKIIRSAVEILSDIKSMNRSSHLHKKSHFICMHLRTESDFMYFFGRAPAAYTREQILAKMNLTRTKLINTTFAKLWSNYQVKPVLYLAGDDKSNAREYFTKTGWFSTVHDKYSVFTPSNKKTISFSKLLVQYNAPSSLISSLRFEVSTVLAIIDTEICKAADLFIGNNHSSLSERIASERQRSNRWEGQNNRTLENGGKYNYMINALNNDAANWQDLSKLEPLHPFCAANSEIFMSYKCNYVRSPV